MEDVRTYVPKNHYQPHTFTIYSQTPERKDVTAIMPTLWNPYSGMKRAILNNIRVLIYTCPNCRQRFDAVGWVAGRTSSL